MKKNVVKLQVKTYISLRLERLEGEKNKIKKCETEKKRRQTRWTPSLIYHFLERNCFYSTKIDGVNVCEKKLFKLL